MAVQSCTGFILTTHSINPQSPDEFKKSLQKGILAIESLLERYRKNTHHKPGLCESEIQEIKTKIDFIHDEETYENCRIALCEIWERINTENNILLHKQFFSLAQDASIIFQGQEERATMAEIWVEDGMPEDLKEIRLLVDQCRGQAPQKA